MRAIESAKSNFLLDAPVEVLHEEVIEWLNETEFWKEESKFLSSLLTGRSVVPIVAIEAGSINEALMPLNSMLKELQALVMEHERNLSETLGSLRQDIESYRVAHYGLARKVRSFENEFRSVKKRIFLLIGHSAKKSK
jgi:hypothetical protein